VATLNPQIKGGAPRVSADRLLPKVEVSGATKDCWPKEGAPQGNWESLVPEGAPRAVYNQKKKFSTNVAICPALLVAATAVLGIVELKKFTSPIRHLVLFIYTLLIEYKGIPDSSENM